MSLTGDGIYSSTAAIKSRTDCSASGSPSRAFKADPLMIGHSVSYPYSPNNSRISISTNSNNSGSST